MERLYLKESRNLKFRAGNLFIALTLAFVLLSTQKAEAQMECRSMIGAHLTPFSKKLPVLWALEGTMAPGIMTSPWDTVANTQLNGGMLLGALEFDLGIKHSFYFEGGFKNWKNSALVHDDSLKKNRHLGMRQAFYSFNGENTKIKIGLHETRLGDFFLVDERILGTSIDQTAGAFTLNIRGGTVMKNFARMGQFCSNRHIYGILHPDYTEKIGGKPGETNLAGLVINWDPHYSKPAKNNKSSDEFSDDGEEFSDGNDEFINGDDEFHENHDFNEFGEENIEKTKHNNFKLTNVGIIFYDEFGSENYIPDNKFYTGALFDMVLPGSILFQTGGVYQNMKNNNTFVYIAKASKNIIWQNASNTKISGAYIGKTDMDKNAIFQPLFSNLFLGEIMRMDAPDFPLWQGAIKHHFPGKLKFHLAIKAVGQIEQPNTNEQDLEAGMLLFNNHLKITIIGSRVQTNILPNEFYMARVEMRLAF